MQTSKSFTMVGIGELLWDVLPQGKQLGGAPANFAYHANQLGNRGVVISSVGNDPDGDEILRQLDAKNIPHQVTQTRDYPTGTVSVEMGDDGIPSYTIQESSAWDHLQLNDKQEEIASQADVVCFGTLAQRNSASSDSIQRFISKTSDECVRLFDINLRQNYYNRVTIEHLLKCSSILKLNDEELLIVAYFFHLFGSETDMLEQVATIFQLDMVILTKGASGSRLYTLDMGDSIFNGVPLDIVDTVGAGDAFSAAVATGLCNKMDLQDIHLFATRVAAFVCQNAGATPELPSLDTLLAPQ